MSENNQRPVKMTPQDMRDTNENVATQVTHLVKTADTIAPQIAQRHPDKIDPWPVYREGVVIVAEEARSPIATAVTAKETPVSEQIKSAIPPGSSGATPDYKGKFFDAQTDNTSKKDSDTSDIPSISGPGNSSRAGG